MCLISFTVNYFWLALLCTVGPEPPVTLGMQALHIRPSELGKSFPLARNGPAGIKKRKRARRKKICRRYIRQKPVRECSLQQAGVFAAACDADSDRLRTRDEVRLLHTNPFMK